MTLLLDPPLDPSGDDARRQLGRELMHPEYADGDIIGRLTRWLGRLIDGAVNAASGTSGLTYGAAILVALVLVVALIALVSRARRTARDKGVALAAVTDESVRADEWRRRAEAALAAGDASGALVDAFRATAVRQVELGRIEDLPQATAHELASALVAVFPAHRDAVLRGADLFDGVLYGDHPARAEQAADLLALDDALAGRVVRR